MSEELFNKIAARIGTVLFLVFVILKSYLIDPGFAFFVLCMISLLFLLEIILRDLGSKGIKFC